MYYRCPRVVCFINVLLMCVGCTASSALEPSELWSQESALVDITRFNRDAIVLTAKNEVFDDTRDNPPAESSLRRFVVALVQKLGGDVQSERAASVIDAIEAPFRSLNASAQEFAMLAQIQTMPVGGDPVSSLAPYVAVGVFVIGSVIAQHLSHVTEIPKSAYPLFAPMAVLADVRAVDFEAARRAVMENAKVLQFPKGGRRAPLAANTWEAHFTQPPPDPQCYGFEFVNPTGSAWVGDLKQSGDLLGSLSKLRGVLAYNINEALLNIAVMAALESADVMEFCALIERIVECLFSLKVPHERLKIIYSAAWDSVSKSTVALAKLLKRYGGISGNGMVEAFIPLKGFNPWQCRAWANAAMVNSHG